MKLLLILILLINSALIFALDSSQLGKCIHDPNAQLLQEKWKRFEDLKKKKAKVNSSLLVKEIRMDQETMRLLQSVSESEILISLLDQLQNNYLKKAFIDTRFNDLISSQDFIAKLESKTIDSEIKNSKLDFKDDPKFYEILDKIRSEVVRPEIKDALELFRTYDLGLLQIEYRKSAKEALKLIRKKGASLTEVRRWINDPPYLRNVPLPHVKLGPFVVVYRNLLMKSIANFVLDRNITLLEAKKFFPNIKAKDLEEINSAVPPVETIAFDEHVLKTDNLEMSAIDGVARTLWGEASSCQDQGLYQFEAIGKIIAERSLAVCRAIKEQESLSQKSTEVREKNWTTFLSNWAGIKRPAPGMQNKPYAKLKGLSDFGRKERMDIPCAAQVVSKKNQFSVWNSYTVKKYHTGQFHPNIPDAIYEIKGPQSPNDDKALVRILCPEFINQAQKDLWKRASELAIQIVQAPEKLVKEYTWEKDLEILFYTHEAPLSFAKEVKVSALTYKGEKLLVKKKAKGVCNKFRLFVPKQSNLY